MEFAIGSYAWSERTEGILNARERRSVLAMLVKTQVAERLDRISTALGLHRAPVDMERIIVPDTAICREAEEQAAGQYDDALHRHCYRTYYFGSLIGQSFGLTWDPEALYVACLLHDAGLTETNAANSVETGFQIVGARIAHEMALRHGWQVPQARALYESISLHLNPHLSRRRTAAEAVLVKHGAVMDVIGAYRHRIPNEQLGKVHDAYPRKGFRNEIVKSITETPHAPHSHAHFLCRCGFGGLAANNPLDGQWD